MHEIKALSERISLLERIIEDKLGVYIPKPIKYIQLNNIEKLMISRDIAEKIGYSQEMTRKLTTIIDDKMR